MMNPLYDNINSLPVEEVSKIVDIVKRASFDSIPNTGLNGCGRIYLSLGYGKMNKSSKIAKALVGIAGIKVTQRPYYTGVCFYMGYDNARGNIASLAEHIAKKLREVNVPACVDYDGD